MSRHSDDLERLCNKLERRFGRADSLFLQAKAELDTYGMHRQMEPIRHDWSTRYGSFIKAFAMNNLTHSHH